MLVKGWCLMKPKKNAPIALARRQRAFEEDVSTNLDLSTIDLYRWDIWHHNPASSKSRKEPTTPSISISTNCSESGEREPCDHNEASTCETTRTCHGVKLRTCLRGVVESYRLHSAHEVATRPGFLRSRCSVVSCPDIARGALVDQCIQHSA
jgi:hypothetical protein